MVCEGMFAFAQKRENVRQRMLICAQCAVKNGFF
jgi:hypothetical protein